MPPYHATTYILHILYGAILSNRLSTRSTKINGGATVLLRLTPNNLNPGFGCILRVYFDLTHLICLLPFHRNIVSSRLLFVTYSTRLKIGHEPRPRSPVPVPQLNSESRISTLLTGHGGCRLILIHNTALSSPVSNFLPLSSIFSN